MKYYYRWTKAYVFTPVHTCVLACGPPMHTIGAYTNMYPVDLIFNPSQESTSSLPVTLTLRARAGFMFLVCSTPRLPPSLSQTVI